MQSTDSKSTVESFGVVTAEETEFRGFREMETDVERDQYGGRSVFAHELKFKRNAEST